MTDREIKDHEKAEQEWHIPKVPGPKPTHCRICGALIQRSVVNKSLYLEVPRP